MDTALDHGQALFYCGYMELLTRQQAKAAGLKRYFTGKPCKHGHTSERQTANGRCVECSKISSRKIARANPEENKARCLKWRENNREKSREDARKWRKNNPEKFAKNRAAWKKANHGKVIAYNRKRYTSKLQRTPAWLTPEQLQDIEKIYIECRKMSVETGVEHHVDHIVPLQGKDVSGLHVPWNLQIITAEENLSKGNR